MVTIYTPAREFRDRQNFITNSVTLLENNKLAAVNELKITNNFTTTNNQEITSILNLDSFLYSPPTINSDFVLFQEALKNKLVAILNNSSMTIGSDCFFNEINSLANKILSTFPTLNIDWFNIMSEVKELGIEVILKYLIQAIEKLIVQIESRSNIPPISSSDILNDEVIIESNDIINRVVDNILPTQSASSVSIKRVSNNLNIGQRNYIFANLFLDVLEKVPRVNFYPSSTPAQVIITRQAQFRNYLNNTLTFDNFQKEFLSVFEQPLPSLITKLSVSNIFSSVVNNDGTVLIKPLSNAFDSFLLENNIIQL